MSMNRNDGGYCHRHNMEYEMIGTDIGKTAFLCRECVEEYLSSLYSTTMQDKGYFTQKLKETIQNKETRNGEHNDMV